MSDKSLTLKDLCPRSPRIDKKHEDDGGVFFFTCKYCGLCDEEIGVDMSAPYLHLGGVRR
jgi:hypothetical protein